MCAAAAVWCVSTSSAFLPARLPRAGHVATARRASKQVQEDMEKIKQYEDKAFDEMLYPPEQMWKTSPDGMIIREKYQGARDFVSIFWSIVQPAASLGFLIVGVSTYVGEPIVDWNPITKQFLGFLRPNEMIQWIPQGIFMSFYGFFGFFLFGPLQLFLVATNKGTGVAEFNKYTRKMTIVRDEEMIKEVDFEDIKQVVMEYSTMSALGSREVYLIDTNGQEIRFMETVDDLPKRVLERRASTLANFLDVDLDVIES